MKARVTVTLKSGVLDPQGKAIEGALKSLGISGVASVRQGKVFDIEIDGGDRTKTDDLRCRHTHLHWTRPSQQAATPRPDKPGPSRT